VVKVALGQGFLPVLRFSLAISIPPTLYTRLHLHVALTRMTKGRSMGNFLKEMHLTEKYFMSVFRGSYCCVTLK